jgi:uncharacterized protein
MRKEIRNQHGERLDYSFHEALSGVKRVAVLGHGVTGNKDRPFLVALAEGLAAGGIPALRFSFSGNGASEGNFTESTISKEVADLGTVLDRLEGEGYEICYIGHSMGGAVGVLRASKDARIRLLVSLAGMVHTEAFAEREFGGVKPGEGFMWEDPDCPLSQAYMDDMRKIHSVADQAGEIRIPWLLEHGTEDDVVPVQDSLDIYEKANEPKEMHLIEGANHVFAGEHTPVMIGKVVGWVRDQVAEM